MGYECQRVECVTAYFVLRVCVDLFVATLLALGCLSVGHAEQACKGNKTIECFPHGRVKSPMVGHMSIRGKCHGDVMKYSEYER